MSPRIAFTTACRDSPSKLKLAWPLLASEGGGALAALWSIGAPLPRRITGAGPASPSSSSTERRMSPSPAACWPACAPGRRSLWRTCGCGALAQPASRTRARPTRKLRIFIGVTPAAISLWLRRRHVFAQLAQLRAPRLDAAAELFDPRIVHRRWRDIRAGGIRRLAGRGGRVAGDGFGGSRRIGGARARRFAGAAEGAQVEHEPAATAFEYRAARPPGQQAPALGAFRRVAQAHALRFAAAGRLQDRQLHARADQHAGEDEVQAAAGIATVAAPPGRGQEAARPAVGGEQRARGGVRVLAQRADP